ncbi:hypothetical protein PVAG01_10965 [Phlyctema vagabunda]|uniref:Nucleolar protein Dnt1-like N-terminal domain-containing protein n=1 Tax=Phlyctema vagabunda TaxID=108571 RepID=A0ABR4P3S4_9HELO
MASNGSMAMSMGPPMLPGYSLRVQLFASDAYSSTDAPVRAFRVITSPDISLRDFCEEASRVHELNYGSPISIKKCQDDQLFDITQSDLLGPLFPNAATIRIIQAAAVPSMRDSVPPTSALRYDYQQIAGRKRDRSASTDPGAGRNIKRSNKRQRISEPNPDRPLPSREQDLVSTDTGSQILEEIIIPNSQRSGSVVLGNGEGSHVPSQQLRSGSRAKSASYHISRPQERGRSVSTAATSPSSADQQLEPSVPNNPSPPNMETPKRPSASNGNKRKPQNEDSLYDDIPSENEGQGSATLQRTRAALKLKSSPRAGLPGLGRSKAREMSSNGSGRSSEERVTPDSKTRKESRGVELGSVNGSHLKAQKAAAAAAEERLRKAEEERLTAEREEAERRKEEEEREAEQARIVEEARIAGQARMAEEVRIAEEARMVEEARLAEEERKAEENRKAEEAEKAKESKARQHAEEEARLAEETKIAEKARQAEVDREAKLQKPDSLRTLRQRSAQVSQKKSATPERAPSREVESSSGQERSSPTQSSTAFIPRGRSTSALKSALSAKSLSPELNKKSPEIERRGVGIEDQMPLSKHRRVSFREQPDISVLPPQPGTKPAVVSSPPIPKSTTPNSSQVSTPVLPPPRVYKETPVPPPRRIAMQSRLAFSGGDTRRQSSIPPASSQASVISKAQSHEAPRSTPIHNAAQQTTSTPKINKPSILSGSDRRSTTPSLPSARYQRADSSARSSLDGRATPVAQRIIPPASLSTRKSLTNHTSKLEAPPSATPRNNKVAAIVPAKGMSMAKAVSICLEGSLHPFKTVINTKAAKSPSIPTASQAAITPRPNNATTDFELPASTQAVRQANSIARKAEDTHVSDSDEEEESDDNDDDVSAKSDDEDEEMGSDRSSLRESRSPVVFNQYPANASSGQKPPHTVTNEDGEMDSSDSESTSSIDGLEQDDLTVVPAAKMHLGDQAKRTNGQQEIATQSGSESDSESDASDDKENNQSQARSQVTSSHEVLLPRLDKHPRTYPHFSSSSSLSTQGEVDCQLTSSMHQVTQSSPSPHVPAKAQTPLSSANPQAKTSAAAKMPQMKYGVSLSQLASAKKPLDGGLSSTANRTIKGSQSALRSLQAQSDDGMSSEEEEDDSSSDSDDSDSKPTKHSRVTSGYTFGRAP